MKVRTTQDLDEDVCALLEVESLKRGVPFGTVLNDLLREGLAHRTSPSRREFSIHARPMGSRAGLNYNDVESLIGLAEGPEHR